MKLDLTSSLAALEAGAAAGSPSPWANSDLAAVAAVFGAALVVAWLMRAVRLPAILGFLIAGVIIGPSALNLVPQDRVQFFAELGLVLLLFTVGLELSPGPLLRMGGRLLAAAGLQISATTLVTAAALRLGLSVPWNAAIIAGLAVSLSSTAIVLKHLSDRGEVDSPAGALTAGVLLIQDVAVIAVLILLPLFAGTAGPLRSTVVGKASLALGGLVVVTLAAWRLMPLLVNLVFRFGGQELMTLFAIVMACTGAWLASLANWSWALGSFIAGLLLAQTDLRHQLRAEITPFRDAFNALFFISIGMLVDLELFVRHAGLLSAAILITLIGKTVLTGGAVLSAGWPLRLALTAGLGLCTISEFGYVLAKEATKLGLLSPEFLEKLIAWAVGTMLLGAVFVPLAGPLAAGLSRRILPEPAPGRLPPPGPPGRGSHVIIVGYGVNGHNLARVLRATRIPYTVVEMQRGTARKALSGGVSVRVIVGDATRRAILDKAGLATAGALVVSIADQHATRTIVAQTHQARPDLYILARTRYVSELEPLYRLGARQVIPEEFETSIEIFAHVLKEFGVPDNVIEQQVTIVRAGHYGMLRGRPTDTGIRAEWLAVLEAAVTQTHLVQDGSPAVGRSIRELALRTRTGVTIVALTRGGKPVASPPAELVLAAGDVLVLVGTHRGLDLARMELEPPVSGEPA
jgi:CPA2 family monovalent cation:H+ antiporter-2